MIIDGKEIKTWEHFFGTSNEYLDYVESIGLPRHFHHDEEERFKTEEKIEQ